MNKYEVNHISHEGYEELEYEAPYLLQYREEIRRRDREVVNL